MKIMDNMEKAKMYFRMGFATMVTAGAGFFLYKVAFIEKSATNEHTGTIVGFILGVALSTVIQFYFGASDKQDKNKNENP